MIRVPLVVGLVCLSACVVQADASGRQLQDEVAQAYRQIDDYRSTVRFQVEQKLGRWVNTQSADLFVALDRDQARLLFDKPDLRVVIDNGKLLMNSPEVPGHHLTLDSPGMELEAIQDKLPFLEQPMAPDLAFLIAADPIEVLGGGAVEVSRVIEDERQQPGLQLATPQGPMTLRIDPQTKLVTSATLTIDAAAMGGDDGDSVIVSYTIDAQPGKAVADDAFAFDTTDSRQSTTVDEFIEAAQGGGEAAQASLEGQDAPPIELKTLDGRPFKLSAVEEPVVVLDFWATWCPPCVEGLPKLQAVSDWAKAENKAVAVYTVNLQEHEAQVRQFLEKNKLSMPVLMDDQGAAAEAYGVQSIPTTVIIHKGKVARVHVGLAPDLEQTLKREIEALLENEGG